jgi:hypothetical protein
MFLSGVYLDNDTCLETVIESHGKRVTVYEHKHIDAVPVVARTLEDVVRLSAELQRRKASHRQATGLTQQEGPGPVGGTPEIGVVTRIRPHCTFLA